MKLATSVILPVMRMWRQLTAVSERLRTYWAVAVPLGADLG